ncbi:hypothetical protein IQ247_09150 [Plectonema cf. radiosum LEGE 06105]|uniref:Uncharacterized protein n=1 Tax=Plectonema cf. radiosum LEGE 06105 TaxID=945769 RepID=A0A8J7K0U5_9CYAN|nr:hypothetical protein [Plectonema radiosum]MBE9212857.1 hypothetical protein [Plectonema cf. radiosum LEGE 06105]
MKCEENIIYTQKSLSQRYGISIAALQYWYPYAGIVKPKKRGGYFALDAVEIADLFYVATKIRRLTHEEYLEKVIPAGGLDKFMRQTNGLSLYDFLTKHIPEEEKQNPIVKVVIRRIERNETHQRSSSNFANHP